MGERQPELPDCRHARPLPAGESFRFSCHPGVPCFTECCRELELALTPYDILRLCRGTGLSSQEFLDRYVIVEFDERDQFPRLYLTMVDDGRASCPFVSAGGCRVYPDRPSACRTYPVGRGVQRGPDGITEHFVLLREPHCRGFEEEKEQTIDGWQRDQEILTYNRYNDLMPDILQAPFFQRGGRLSPPQAELFLLALYNLDRFREKLKGGELETDTGQPPPENMEDLLVYAIHWYGKRLDEPL